MKVLHVINSLNTGGAEKLLLESLSIYHDKGVKADLLVLNGTEYPFLKQLKENFKGNIYNLGNGSVYNPILIFKIISYLKKYDILNVHLFPTLYWVSLSKIISFSKTKLVYTEHNTSNKRRSIFIFKLIDKLLYVPYIKIITIADEVDQNLKNHLNFNSTKYKLINNGINIKKYTNAKPYEQSSFFDNSKILIQVSSFTKQKDQKTLIKSLTLLPINITLLLVGDGPLIGECKNLVKELNLKKRVLFLGIRMDVPKLLKTADIIVLSSHHEGLSISSIEAMASGKPFIASNVPGLKEIVKDAGLLYNDGDVNGLSKHIVDLLSDNELYANIRDKCLKKANEFDIDIMVNKYISLYKNIS